MSDEFTGQVLADKYQIDELLQESDLSGIYRGTHLSMEKPIVVKILSPALAVDENIVRQFAAEARTVSRFSHPNILNVTDYGQDPGGLVYIIFEGVEGESLKTALDREGKFAPERASRIARQIAAALSAAHSGQLVHRHLNTANIFLTAGLGGVESVKVADFASIDMDENSDRLSIEKTAYLSPEQYAEISESDERSDIYSLGVIFYEMLAGVVPFTAETPTELMLKKSDELPPPLSAFRDDLPEGIEPVILHALAKNPDMRQQSAAEFVAELNRATDYSAGQETMVMPAAVRDEPPNNLWKTAFIVLVGVSVLAGAFIYATSVKQTDPQTQMQMDANGQPVQPLNPATGLNEQGMSNMMPYPPEMMMGNSNMQMPEIVPGGDGYDAWGRGVQPPPGAPPSYSQPPGGFYTVPGDSNSIFMQDETGTYILVPKETNANVSVQPTPSKSPKTPPANAQPTPAAKESPAEANQPPAKTEATPSKPAKPTPNPADKPRENPPASTERRTPSGKEQDT